MTPAQPANLEVPKAPKMDMEREFRLSKREGLAFSMMVGLGETYLPAFVLAVGMGEVTSGLIATIPILIGAIFQTQTPYLVNRLRSYKQWILLCVGLQTCALGALSWMAYTQKATALEVFIAASLYWACAMSAGPTWNAWMGTIVPPAQRTRFWSQRTHISQIGTLAGFVMGGLLLQHLVPIRDLSPFLPIFILALLGRSLSCFLLSRQHEPENVNARLVEPLTASPLSCIKKQPSYTFIKYVLFIHFSTFIASPFFTPYMLQHLKLDYFGYAVLTAAALAAKFISLPFISKLIVQRSTRTVIRLAGVGIATLPVLWLVSDWFPYLLFIQLVGGVFWGALDLAFPLLIIESIPDKERLSALTSYNLLRSGAIVIGSLLGGAILYFTEKGLMGYVIIFSLSTGLRALSIGTMWTFPISRLRIMAFWRVIGIAPIHGAILSPILSSIQKIQSKKKAKAKPPEKPSNRSAS